MQTHSRFLKPKVFRYAAFISFRGADTRPGFVGFLHRALTKRNFRTFLDDRDIRLGDRITIQLPKAIEESRCFIIVLSENYASSSFCLDELVKILLELSKGNGRWILPVFFYVNLHDVQNQTGKFGEALDFHKKNHRVTPEKLEEWTNALTTIVDFSRSGLHLQRTGDKYEYQYIEEIVQEVSRHEACSTERDHRVGEVINCLYSGGDKVCVVVGICGDSGIGKTTVARGVYRFYAIAAGNEFDCCCFFGKAGDYSSKKRLVLMLLSELIVGDHTIIENVDEGMSMIKHILNQKKVFMTFVDIEDPEVLRGIVELTTCFGDGSKVIITTRDKCFLEFHGIKIIYEVERMNKTEAFQLLNLKAFNSVTVNPRHVTILESFEAFAAGHPFILEVIGSYLGGKSIAESEYALHQYRKIPNKETKKILQVTFDALGELQQKMLIRIALNLKGLELAVVEDKLLCENEVCPKEDIRVLLDTSLIKINELGQVTLHELTLDMVRDNNVPPEEDPDEVSMMQTFEEYGKREIQAISSHASMFLEAVRGIGVSTIIPILFFLLFSGCYRNFGGYILRCLTSLTL